MESVEKYIKNKYKNYGQFDNGYYNVTTALPEEMPKTMPLLDLYGLDDGLEGKWGLCDSNGKELIKPQYLFPLHRYDNLYMVSIPIQNEEGIIVHMLSGLVDENNNEIVPIKYGFMTPIDDDGNYFKVWDEELEKDGIIDRNNNIIVPFVYDYISHYLKYDQIEISNNGLYGIYDLKLNKEIISPKYQSNTFRIEGYNLFGIEYGKNKIYINEKEEIIRNENE